ncbi:MAG: hypothetical protein JWN98_280, partial [Abditibacteriota bacterium]|nr:hypothetical protein [Abditibacteriota bacterium]
TLNGWMRSMHTFSMLRDAFSGSRTDCVKKEHLEDAPLESNLRSSCEVHACEVHAVPDLPILA